MCSSLKSGLEGLVGPVSKVMKKKEVHHYRGTSIIRHTPPVGPYGRTMRRLLGGGTVSYDRGTPVT